MEEPLTRGASRAVLPFTCWRTIEEPLSSSEWPSSCHWQLKEPNGRTITSDTGPRAQQLFFGVSAKGHRNNTEAPNEGARSVSMQFPFQYRVAHHRRCSQLSPGRPSVECIDALASSSFCSQLPALSCTHVIGITSANQREWPIGERRTIDVN